MNRRIVSVLAVGLVCVVAVSAGADELRNVKVGQPVPAFEVAGLDGKPVTTADYAGKVLLILYVSAEQRQSETALESAHITVSRIGSTDLKLIYMSPNTDRAEYFRRLRDRLTAHEPFGLDEGRRVYGELGLIVFPTTIVADKAGKLRHVISGWTRDYEFQLDLYARHALGEFDDAELQKRLQQGPLVKDEARDKANRHRAAAEILRQKGLAASAVKELEKAIAIDPTCVDAVLELADIHVAEGKLDEAQRSVDDLLKRMPEARGTELILGLIRLRKGDYDKAEKLLTDALVLNPDPVRTHYYLGQLYEARGDCPKAMEHYREAIKRMLKDE